MPMVINKTIIFFSFLALIVVWSSCRTDFKFKPATGELRFSKDTVYLDTVFSKIGSSTYTLKVYNTSNDNISIPSIKLELPDSKYRINIDGMSGDSFENVELLAKDSIYVFIETTVEINDFTTTKTQYLYTDKLVFNQVGTIQKVDLVTLVQDAVLLYPEKHNDGTYELLEFGKNENGDPLQIRGFYLSDGELVFTNNKPYVIYGYAAVPPQKTAVFQAGARVHFHKDSGIIATDKSTILVQGLAGNEASDIEHKVIFEGDRLEPGFADVPGQWGTIWLTSGSSGHSFNNCIIRNATVGILTDYNDETSNPTLSLVNTEIYNSEAFGLWAKTGHIDAENCVFGNAGQSVFYGNIGGKYEFRHCTFANYWNRSYRDQSAVRLDNFIEQDGDSYLSAPLEKAQFDNCIIAGDRPIEWELRKLDGVDFNFQLNHTMVQFENDSGTGSDNSLYSFENINFYVQTIQNETPDFKDPNNTDFRIGNTSDAISKGDPAVSSLVPFDLLKKSRVASPDLGAYQHIEFD